MGVPGLWDILRPAGKQRSLTHLAVVDGFETNTNKRRGLRIGIDASIWFYHAAYGKEGENPELRTLFFRCARLMGKPFLPLFVFDGPKRPDVKRGKRISGKNHWLTTGMQRIIEAFGFEWRMAPGEAEAELAYLNRVGIIDAIISDDVDSFLFGATMLIRNPSKSLSGNRGHPIKNAAGKEDDEHVITYRSVDFLKHDDIQLTVGGLILIGLLRGGDYHQEGLPGCGPTIAHGLARCGFGDTLLDAVQNLPRDDLPDFLVNWRHEVRQELKTNSRGFIGSKRVKLAASLPETFPDIDVLLSYTNPITSESEGRGSRISYTWNREPDLGRLAGICELFFEWGVKDVIVKRFRTVLWSPIVLRILRRAVLDDDEKRHSTTRDVGSPSTPKKNKAPTKVLGTPSTMITHYFSSLDISTPSRKSRTDNCSDDDDDEEKLVVKIHSKRTHASTDGVPEYRLEIAPAQLVRLTEAGVKGIRPPIENGDELSDDDFDGEGDGKPAKRGTKNPPVVPDSHLRVWMPACMVRLVEPTLVEEFEGVKEKREMKKKAAEERKKEREAKGLTKGKAKTRETEKGKTKGTRVPSASSESEAEAEDFSEVFGLKSVATKTGSGAKRISKTGVVRKLQAKSTKNKQPTIVDVSDEEGGEDFGDVFGISKATSRVKSKTRRRHPVVHESEEEEAEAVLFAKQSSIAWKDLTKKTKTSSATLELPPISARNINASSRVGSILDYVDRHSTIGGCSPSVGPSTSQLPRKCASSQASTSTSVPSPLDSKGIHGTNSKTCPIPPTTPKARKKLELSDSGSRSPSPTPRKSPRKNKMHVSPKVSPQPSRTASTLEEDEDTDLEFDVTKLLRPLDLARMRGIARRDVATEDKAGVCSKREPSSSSSSSRASASSKPQHDPFSSGSLTSLSVHKPVPKHASTKLMPPDKRKPTSVAYVEISSDSEDEQSQTKHLSSQPGTKTSSRSTSAKSAQKTLAERTNAKSMFEYMPVRKTQARGVVTEKTKSGSSTRREVEVIDLT